jgi:nucleosome assembly protein 1-like 1
LIMADPETQKEEVEEIDAEEHGNEELNKALMKNPEVLAAVQDHLMMQSPAEYVRSLPKSVKRRLKALKRLQADANKVESRFYEEVDALERKYAALYDPFFERRREIISAQVEPNDEECNWPSDEEDELADEMKAKAKIEEITESKESKDEEAKKLDENTKGVPDFWLTVFKNVDMLAEMIQPHDEPILKHLQDVKLKMNDGNGFTLQFVFEPNEYFTNAVLTKDYAIRFSVDDENPLGYEGPDIIKCSGCTIDWKKGKNVTVKVVKKVQKHKGRGTKRTVTKTVQNDSFFNFFNPPQVAEEEPDEETEALMTADFEIGHFFRESIIPRAILYFTGEAIEDDDEDYEGEDEEDEHDEDEEEDDEEGDHHHHHHHAVKGGKKPQQQEECKQQ